MDAQSIHRIRAENAGRLRKDGFRFAPSLPLRSPEDCALRPVREVVDRLAALRAVVSYVSAPEDRVPTEPLRAFVDRFRLDKSMTPDELEMWDVPRAEAHEAHVDGIGWRMENMVPLAWALGCPVVPRYDGQMLDGEDLREVVMKFAPSASRYEEFVAKASLRPLAEVVAMEDLFYCAHNAVRSAQLGERGCVPRGFDPIAGGGVVHERRHGLTWILSPGVRWDETDLST